MGRLEQATADKPPVLVRAYRGNEWQARRSFQWEAAELAKDGYFPSSQSWAPGSYGCASFLVALLLCVLIVGILIFIYMILVKPPGTLSVTYQRQQRDLPEGTVGAVVTTRSARAAGAALRIAEIGGDGAFGFEIAGESHYQAALEAIVGERAKSSAHFPCSAILKLEPDNPYDSHAVRVDIGGETVGYIPRHMASEFTQAAATANADGAKAEAVIVGGWERGADRGEFGVRLNITRPFTFQFPSQRPVSPPG